jgi:hypothetical protein
MPKSKNKKFTMTGIHILGGIYTKETKKLNFPKSTKKYISKIIKKI